MIRVWLLVLMLLLAPKATLLVKLLVLQLPVPLRAVLLPVEAAMVAWAAVDRAQVDPEAAETAAWVVAWVVARTVLVVWEAAEAAALLAVWEAHPAKEECTKSPHRKRVLRAYRRPLAVRQGYSIAP